MAEVRYIEYQDKAIISADFSGAKTDLEAKEVMEKASKLVSINRNADVLIMYNISNFKLSKSVINYASTLIVRTAHKVKRRAFIIDDRRLEQLVDAFVRSHGFFNNTAVFSTETSAMNYLVTGEY